MTFQWQTIEHLLLPHAEDHREKSASTPGMVALADGSHIAVRAGQAIVWLSVTARNVVQLPTNWPRFPAVLDTGFNAGLLISHRQLSDWAAINVTDLVRFSSATTVRSRVDGREVPSYQATISIHCRNFSDNDDSDRPPIALYPSGGILVTPPTVAETRLPLLGTELLRSCCLRLTLEPTHIDPILLRQGMQFTLESLLED
jgi:hypothetical protein